MILRGRLQCPNFFITFASKKRRPFAKLVSIGRFFTVCQAESIENRPVGNTFALPAI
jgi:hypothetical protein